MERQVQKSDRITSDRTGPDHLGSTDQITSPGRINLDRLKNYENYENVLPILLVKCLLQKLSQSSTIKKSLATFLRGLEQRSPAILVR